MDRQRTAEKLIKAWRLADAPDRMGFFGDESVFTNIKGEIEDALMILTGEDNKDYTVSMTYSVLNNFVGTAREAAASLINSTKKPVEKEAYEVKQPAPVFFTKEQIDRMQKVFGGYRYDG